MTIQPARLDPPLAQPAVQSVWGSDGFGFDDLIDIVNPLQHLPFIGPLYRQLVGDEIGMVPRMLGGLLFGGPTGLALATVNAGIEAGTGREVSEHLIALATDETPSVAADYAAASDSYGALAAVASTAAEVGGFGDATAPPPEAALAGASVSIIGARERLMAELERESGLGPERGADLVT